MIRLNLRTLLPALAALTISFGIVGCSNEPDDVEIPKGTADKPDAPGIGDAPGVIDTKTGQPVGGQQAPGKMGLPGKKGGN